jgi:hypothetical protein
MLAPCCPKQKAAPSAHCRVEQEQKNESRESRTPVPGMENLDDNRYTIDPQKVLSFFKLTKFGVYSTFCVVHW